MALSVYTPTGIVHETSVDFTKRVLTEPVHLVQYDESLPVVAVTCLDAGQYMTLTASDTVSIRMDKGDGTFIYNPALGMSADGHIVYIQITLQMTVNYGRFEPVLELLRDGGYGASSPIPMFIDANPVPNSEIQSTSQWESLNDIVARANAIVAGDAVEFTEAEERENIESGENLITMFGKIKKWFSDLPLMITQLQSLITQTKTIGNNYVVTKFPDGTMIQQVWTVVSINTVQIGTTGIYQSLFSYTLPESFISNNDVVINGVGRYETGFAVALGCSAISNLNQVAGYIYDFYQRSGDCSIRLVAIGRWK